MLPNEDADPCRIVSILSFSCRAGFLFSRRLRDFIEVTQRQKLKNLEINSLFACENIIITWQKYETISLLQRVMQSVTKSMTTINYHHEKFANNSFGINYGDQKYILKGYNLNHP